MEKGTELSISFTDKTTTFFLSTRLKLLGFIARENDTRNPSLVFTLGYTATVIAAEFFS